MVEKIIIVCYNYIMSEKRRKKPARIYGKYVTDRSEAECARAQLVRLILIVIADALMAISVFIPSDSMSYMSGNAKEGYPGVLWLNTLYLIIFLTMLVTAVFVSVSAARGAKFAVETSEKCAPSRGLDSRLTFASFELDFLLRVAWSALQIYITVMAFDFAGVVLSVMAVASAALSFAVRTFTSHFYRGHTVYKPPVRSASRPTSDEDPAQDFYTADSDLPERPDGADGRAEGAVLNEASDEAEDFYGDGQ